MFWEGFEVQTKILPELYSLLWFLRVTLLLCRHVYTSTPQSSACDYHLHDVDSSISPSCIQILADVGSVYVWYYMQAVTRAVFCNSPRCFLTKQTESLS